MTALHRQLHKTLRRHRGATRAISVSEISLVLGTDERTIRRLKRGLVLSGVLIGSTCAGKSAGYFIPQTPDEVLATIGNYKSRIAALLLLVKATHGSAAVHGLLGQLTLDFTSTTAEQVQPGSPAIRDSGGVSA